MLKSQLKVLMFARLSTIRVSKNGKLRAGSWNGLDRRFFQLCVVEHVLPSQEMFKVIKERLLQLGLSDTDYHRVYNLLLGRNAT